VFIYIYIYIYIGVVSEYPIYRYLFKVHVVQKALIVSVIYMSIIKGWGFSYGPNAGRNDIRLYWVRQIIIFKAILPQ
jgi:hypothetical protein